MKSLITLGLLFLKSAGSIYCRRAFVLAKTNVYVKKTNYCRVTVEKTTVCQK